MKFILIALVLAVAMPAYSGSREAKAIGAAAALRHPKGSGIGTTKYNIQYNRDYSVDKYQRVVDSYGRGYPNYYLPQPKANK